MFAELVELGKRVRKVHEDALKEEKCSWDIVIDKEGTFLNLTELSQVNIHSSSD